MANLPIVSGSDAVKAFGRLGFFVDRQRGSHCVLKKVTPQGERGCVIPNGSIPPVALRIRPGITCDTVVVRTAAARQEPRPTDVTVIH